MSHWPTVLALHIATWLHRQPAADPGGPSEYLQPARRLEEASRLCSENVLCPLHLHCRYKHFAFIATTITITAEREGCEGRGECQLCWHRKISAWPESENGRWRESERECNIYCLQSLVYYFTCISLGSLLPPLYTLPPLLPCSVGIPLAPSSSTSLYAALGWREHL